MLLLGVLGVGAGALTTVAGVGGGLVLLLALSLALDPVTALACTAPALVVGNVHRTLLVRRSIDRPIALRFVAGALPGSVLGAFVAGVVPPDVVRWLLVASTALSVVRAVGAPRWRVTARVMSPAGLTIGALTGSTGGAGMLAGPLLLAAGLSGDAYVGTAAACGTALQAGRMIGYGLAGLFTADRLALSLVLTVAIVAGNQLGRRGHDWFARWPAGLVEHAVLVVCVALALVGVGR